MNEPEMTPTAEPETAVLQKKQPPAAISERLILFIVALVAIGLDQFTKYLVESNLALFEVYAPIPSLESMFRIFHIYNTGATFGLFAGGGDIFRYLAILVSLGIICYNHILPGNQRLLRLALLLMMLLLQLLSLLAMLLLLLLRLRQLLNHLLVLLMSADAAVAAAVAATTAAAVAAPPAAAAAATAAAAAAAPAAAAATADAAAALAAIVVDASPAAVEIRMESISCC